MSALRTFRILSPLALFMVTMGLAHADTINVPEGTITVTDVVTPIGSQFQYDYTVSDTTGLLAVLDIAVTPGQTITGITAPGGPSDFQTAYDSVLGLVSFLENNAVFTSAPESGFIFDSPVSPGNSSFDVTLFDGTTGSGSVQAPLGSVPEPGSLGLCATGVAALVFWRKRLRRS